jgi:ATP-dependent exoDNAse (exonuclease V) beta subunit
MTVAVPPILEVRAASAGTGKTTSLVLEYLEALRHTPSRRIAAVTFTRLGAMDLRERLRAGLREVLETGTYLHFTAPSPEPYRRALREIGSGVITTIHGFYRDLLRLNAPALGLDPEFTYLDEGEAGNLFLEAASSALAQAALNDAPGGEVLATWGWERTLETLESLHGKRVYAPFFIAEEAPDGLAESLLALYHVTADLYSARLAGRALGPTDVELQTLRLLESPEILSRIRSRFHLLLVDEFQDVNPLQAKIFQGLQLPRTLLVGDAKQSIYAFRDADVNAFLDVYGRARRLEPLTVSYRHGKSLARFYSSLAESLFPEFTELGLPAGVQSGRRDDQDDAPKAEFHIFEAASLAEGRASEAALLTQRLRELHAEGVPWGDMAVLVRSRGSVPLLESAFSGGGVPFLVGSGQKYFDRREIRDALSILRARLGLTPQTVAALSRLPGVGVPLLELQDWLLNRNGILAGVAQSTSPEGARLRQLLETIEDSGDAIDLLVRAWVLLGTRLTSRAQSHANLDGLLYQLAAQGTREVRSAVQFLERARLSEAQGDEPLEAGDSVRIVTVHSSKGLEFPVTAVFDLSRGDRNSLDEAVIHANGEVALKPRRALGSRYEAIRHSWDARRAGENNRLLYVALTRAKDRLIITGSKAGKPRGWMQTMLEGLKLMEDGANMPGLTIRTHTESALLEATRAARTETAYTSSALVDAELARARFRRPAPTVRAPSRAPEATGEPLPEDLAYGAERDEFTTQISIPSRLESDDVRGDLPMGDLTLIPDAERVVGTLVHYAIGENLHPTNATHRKVLSAQYSLHAYPEHERAALLERAWWLVERYEILSADKSLRVQDFAELPFAFKRDQTTWQGVIDRLYQLRDGTWFLEDYKTDDVPESALPQRASAYHRQIALYWEAVRQSRGITPTARLTFLRYGISFDLSRAELEAALENA